MRLSIGRVRSHRSLVKNGTYKQNIVPHKSKSVALNNLNFDDLSNSYQHGKVDHDKNDDGDKSNIKYQLNYNGMTKMKIRMSIYSV